MNTFSSPEAERKPIAGLNNPHYLEIRRMIEAGLPIPASFYNERFVGPNWEQRPIHFDRASFSCAKPR